MNALIIDPDYPIQMRHVDPTLRDSVGNRALSVRDQYAKPAHEFSIRFPVNDRETADALYAFYMRHRGSVPFLFDGAGRGEIVEPQLFFVGDGSQTEFEFPFDNLIAPTWVVYENGAVRSDWTLYETAGLIVFDAAPALNAQITAKGRRWVKCLFWGDGETMLSSEEFADKVFNEGVTLREVV